MAYTYIVGGIMIKQFPLRQPTEVGLIRGCNKELFREGYEHGLKSNVLTNFKASYREGFRKAKLEIREYYKLKNMPVQFKAR